MKLFLVAFASLSFFSSTVFANPVPIFGGAIEIDESEFKKIKPWANLAATAMNKYLQLNKRIASMDDGEGSASLAQMQAWSGDEEAQYSLYMGMINQSLLRILGEVRAKRLVPQTVSDDNIRWSIVSVITALKTN